MSYDADELRRADPGPGAPSITRPPSRPRRSCPGETPVPVSGRVFDAEEMRPLVDASLDFWLTTGRFADAVRAAIRPVLRHPRMRCWSTPARRPTCWRSRALTSPKLGDRRLRPGDEVITVAAGFPTTVNPILQNGLVPVFVDVHVPTYNIDVTPARSRAVAADAGDHARPHAGQSVRPGAVTAFAERHDLWLIEDCCDARRARPIDGQHGRHLRRPGHRQLLSRPPHHDGRRRLRADRHARCCKTLVESFRDWGRDCWCDPGKDNTCGKRFDWQLGELPRGYDHKYTYSHIGYNLKVTDMQAAVGVAQLEKLPGFIEARRRNFRRLREGLASCEEFFVLPEADAGFGPELVRLSRSPCGRRRRSRATRSSRRFERRARSPPAALFAGNLVRQPAYSRPSSIA